MNTFDNVFNILFSDVKPLSSGMIKAKELIRSVIPLTPAGSDYIAVARDKLSSVETDYPDELTLIKTVLACFHMCRINSAQELGYHIKIVDDGGYVMYSVRSYSDVVAIVNKLYKEKSVSIIIDELEFTDTPVYKTCEQWAQEVRSDD